MSDWLVSADVALTVLHVAVVLAILFLWIPRRTRRWHLWLVLATALSWFALGLRYGIGYCFLSDWHWQVKRWRGQTDLPNSFIHHALADWLRLPLTETSTEVLTGLVFAFVGVLSLMLNIGEWRRRRPSQNR
jgi:hypothetical protein